MSLDRIKELADKLGVLEDTPDHDPAEADKVMDEVLTLYRALPTKERVGAMNYIAGLFNSKKEADNSPARLPVFHLH